MVFEKNVAGAWKHLDEFKRTSLYMLGQVWVSLDEFGSELILHFWIILDHFRANRMNG